MSWRATAAALIVVVSVIIVQSLVTDPLINILESLAGTGDYSNVAGTGLDGGALITGFAGDWLNMGLILIFGIMAWAIARVVRRELTRGRI